MAVLSTKLMLRSALPFTQITGVPIIQLGMGTLPLKGVMINGKDSGASLKRIDHGGVSISGQQSEFPEARETRARSAYRRARSAKKSNTQSIQKSLPVSQKKSKGKALKRNKSGRFSK